MTGLCCCVYPCPTHPWLPLQSRALRFRCAHRRGSAWSPPGGFSVSGCPVCFTDACASAPSHAVPDEPAAAEKADGPSPPSHVMSAEDSESETPFSYSSSLVPQSAPSQCFWGGRSGCRGYPRRRPFRCTLPLDEYHYCYCFAHGEPTPTLTPKSLTPTMSVCLCAAAYRFWVEVCAGGTDAGASRRKRTRGRPLQRCFCGRLPTGLADLPHQNRASATARLEASVENLCHSATPPRSQVCPGTPPPPYAHLELLK